MILKSYVSRLLAAATLVVSSAVLAQPVSQWVNPSSGVNSNTQFKEMPRSNVIISPGATANSGVYTSQVNESTRSPRGTRDMPRGTRDGSGWVAQRDTATSTSSGRRTVTTTVTTGTATRWGADDRNVNSPGRGYAKGKIKHEEKHKDKHKNKHKNKHKDKHKDKHN